jgi:hypothetical protein
MGEKGQLKIKMHDKLAALDKLARALGMYQDRVDVASQGPPIVPQLNITGAPDKLLARREAVDSEADSE